MNAGIIIASVYITFFGLFLVHITRGTWMSFLHLVDKRAIIQNETTKDKLNQMFMAGDVSMYASHYGGETNYRISLSYKVQGTEDETVSNYFRGAVLDEVIEEAYTWSLERGFVK